MKLNKHISSEVIATTSFVVFAYWLLAVKNGYMLRWYDEMSLFEPTRHFLQQFLYYPGGLLRYAGAWLTQLMYYPWLGSTAIIILWLLLAFITRKAFHLSDSTSPFSLLIPTAMLVSVVQLDEAWLSLKSVGYIFSNTLGYVFTIAIVLLYHLSRTRPNISAAISILTPFFYPVAGFFALLAGALCVLISVSSAIRERKYLQFISSGITILLIAILPPLYYKYLSGNTVDNDYLYLKGLPELMMESFDWYLWLPFVASTIILLLLTLFSIGGTRKNNVTMKWVSIAMLCCGAIWGIQASHKSEQLRATVLMLQRLDRNDWQGMRLIMSRIKEPPNYTMLILNNLAIVNQGGQGESLSGMSPSPGDGRHSEKFTMTAFVQVPLYYNIGRLNQSYRWAMEHTVQYGKRVFFLKYMVKDALLRGEISLAKRYNDILLSTMFHRKWAAEMNRYIENPSLIKSDPNFERILKLGEGEQQRNKETGSGETAEIH